MYQRLASWGARLCAVEAPKFTGGSNRTQAELSKGCKYNCASFLFPHTNPLYVEGPSLVDLVLEDVQVVCGCDGDNVLLRVPRSVEDLLAEVQAINADLVLTTLPAYTHLEDAGRDRHPDEIKQVQRFAPKSLGILLKSIYLAGLEDGSGFAVLPGRFQRDIAFSVPVKHSEEVVVRACHYDTEDKIRRLGREPGGCR